MAQPLGNILITARVTTRSGEADGAISWWYQQYIARHQAERAARRERDAREADLFAIVPMPTAAGVAETERPAASAAVVPMVLARGAAYHLDPDEQVLEALVRAGGVDWVLRAA
jgi:hypothetical protein